LAALFLALLKSTNQPSSAMAVLKNMDEIMTASTMRKGKRLMGLTTGKYTAVFRVLQLLI
jgi:hypothetical protein